MFFRPTHAHKLYLSLQGLILSSSSGNKRLCFSFVSLIGLKCIKPPSFVKRSSVRLQLLIPCQFVLSHNKFVNRKKNIFFQLLAASWAASSKTLLTDQGRLFHKDSQGRRGAGVTHFVKENCECIEVNYGPVGCLVVKNRGVISKVDLTVGICYRPPNQDSRANNIWVT